MHNSRHGIFCGCTSYFSNLTAAKHNLPLNQYAIFEKEGNRFTAQITDIKGISSASRVYSIDITVRVENPGTKPVSLMAYPSLSDTEEISIMGKASSWEWLARWRSNRKKQHIHSNR